MVPHSGHGALGREGSHLFDLATSMCTRLPARPPSLAPLQDGRERYSAMQGRWGGIEREDVTSGCFLPGGWLVTGTASGRLLVWDVSSERGSLARCMQAVNAHGIAVSSEGTQQQVRGAGAG